MTLSQWCQENAVLPTHPTTEQGAVSLLADHQTPRFSVLFNLEDYRVSTLAGPVVWLIPTR